MSNVVKILIAAFVVSMFLAGNPAQAQTGTAPAKKCLIPLDPLKLCGLLTGNVVTDYQRVASRIKSATHGDLAYAIAMAKASGTDAGAVRLQCIQAVSDARDKANGEGLKNGDGTPMVRPEPAFVTAIEELAELIDNLSPQGKLSTSCAGAAQMFKTNTLAAINGIVTGAAGLAAGSAALAL